MATTLTFKDIVDVPVWRPESVTIAANAAGSCIVNDMRNDSSRHPYLYFLRSATAFDFFDPTTGDWVPLASPALTGTFGAGATAIFHPSQGPRGTLAAGSTTTTINITTALPASVGINQLANRGDGVGFKIRIIGSSAGSSGKIEERTIIANTSGTTPVITLDTALSFTPAATDLYEIISGRVFLLSAGVMAAGCWKYYDIATNSFSGSLSVTGLPASITTDTAGIALSELHVSNDRSPSSGLVSGGSTYNASSPIQAILATASGASSITGSGMAALFTNEYVNFQVRIVEDTVNATAVGQRRRISSHTSGATGVFTLAAAWSSQPSSSAKFVIENDDDKIFLRTSSAVLIYNYNIAANTWDTSTWAAPAANGAGVVGAQAFGITRDVTGNTRQSMVYFIRGGASASIDVLDISAAATGSWSNAITYGNSAQTFTTGNSGTYDPATLGGRFMHINVNGTQRMARFDMRNRFMDAGTYLRFPGGVATVGGKMATALFVDGTTKLTFVYFLSPAQTQMFSLAVQR